MGCASPQNAGVPNIPPNHLQRVYSSFNIVVASSTNYSSSECQQKIRAFIKN